MTRIPTGNVPCSIGPLNISCALYHWRVITASVLRLIAPLSRPSMLKLSLSPNNLSSIRIIYTGLLVQNPKVC